jgi:hypothetical protein
MSLFWRQHTCGARVQVTPPYHHHHFQQLPIPAGLHKALFTTPIEHKRKITAIQQKKRKSINVIVRPKTRKKSISNLDFAVAEKKKVERS